MQACANATVLRDFASRLAVYEQSRLCLPVRGSARGLDSVWSGSFTARWGLDVDAKGTSTLRVAACFRLLGHSRLAFSHHKEDARYFVLRKHPFSLLHESKSTLKRGRYYVYYVTVGLDSQQSMKQYVDALSYDYLDSPNIV